MSTKGKILSWNDEKGFGFIAPSAGGRQIFVHIKDFSNSDRRPEINELVTFTLSTDKQGRPCAAKATLAGDRKTKPKSTSLSIFAAIIFFVLVGFSVLASKIPPLIFAVYMVASLLTFIAYAIDKSAAKNGSWRTQENTLHFLSLVGGWPGALVAQQKLRHKSKKQPFQSIFWVTVILNNGAFIWLFTPTGNATLQSLVTKVL